MTGTPDFATKPTLAGELAVLRPFTAADLPAMREALLDLEARILTGTGAGRPDSRPLRRHGRDREYPIAPKCCYC